MLAWMCVVLNKFSPVLHVGFLWRHCVWKRLELQLVVWKWLECKDVHSGNLSFYLVILLNTFYLKMLLSPLQLCNIKVMPWLPFPNNSVYWIWQSPMLAEMTAADWVWTVLKNLRMQHVVQVGLKWKKKKDGVWIYVGILLVKESKNFLLTIRRIIKKFASESSDLG